MLVKYKVGLRPTEHQLMDDQDVGEDDEQDTDSLLTSTKQRSTVGKGMLSSFTKSLNPQWAQKNATAGPTQGGNGGGVVRGGFMS